MRRVRVLVPDPPPVDALGPLPDGVVLVPVGEGPVPPEAADARMAILAGPLFGRVEDILEAAPGLEVVQTVSAGVDFLAGRLPDGITLCNASGAHDTPVAEWVLAAILAMTRKLPEFLAL